MYVTMKKFYKMMKKSKKRQKWPFWAICPRTGPHQGLDESGFWAPGAFWKVDMVSFKIGLHFVPLC